jgi:hypothetical protein
MRSAVKEDRISPHRSVMAGTRRGVPVAMVSAVVSPGIPAAITRSGRSGAIPAGL